MVQRDIKEQLVSCAKIIISKPLESRKENNVMYPMLSAVARGTLAVPAQSASSERVE